MLAYSPLRYPGGKRRLANYFELLIHYNNLYDSHYIEPFAGGAAVGLHLLFQEFVSQIHINDVDKSIYSFWYSVLNEPDRLCKKIFDTEISIEEWHKQKLIQKRKNESSKFDLGFSTFFLNRTNRSGILKAGVIGGKNQNGIWKMNARYNKKNLIKRIRKVSSFKQRINIYNDDAVNFVKEVSSETLGKSLYYFDPPYFLKGKDLYINYYQYKNHLEISSLIKKMNNRFWVVSYDNHEEIKKLYINYNMFTYTLPYSAGNNRSGTELMIFSDKFFVPNISNPINRKEIKSFQKTNLFPSNNFIFSD